MSVSEVEGCPKLLQLDSHSDSSAKLSDAFYYAQGRWTRDESTATNLTALSTRSATTENDSPDRLISTSVEKDPPQLAPLPDLSYCNLERSSTLRACIGKASDDVNIERKPVQHLVERKDRQRLPFQSKPRAARDKITPIPAGNPYGSNQAAQSKSLASSDIVSLPPKS
ncbi:hypothetical protein F66182_4698 [Fusarium sp. NRRL 66182]|nr:hypothetical protein F66182_4698 [Fusarium sp. NRRL 66182]